ncbi:MAG: hypothetical protein ACE5NL_00710, partial [Candidatus Hydrothermarchaeaceae archaeon]
MNKATLLLIFLFLPSAHGLGADFYVVDVSPQNVYPGEDVMMNITIKNLGEEYATYLSASLDPNDLTPISAVGAMKIAARRIEGGSLSSPECFGSILQTEKTVLEYRVHVNESASTGTYNVPLNLTWVNKVRETATQEIYVGINVIGSPNLVISSISTTPSKIYADSDF